MALSAVAAAAQDTDSTSAMNMNMAGMENPLGFPSSGTSVEPESTKDSTPMMHWAMGKWNVMFHANVFLENIQQTGPRGGDKLFSANWFMPMIARKSGRHTVAFRTMLSFEPATVTDRRFPQLFQSGETAFGLPIVDGQHPHNFVMELSGRYEFNLNLNTQLFLYGGPLAEPALGPPAFPHRASSSENPLAMLGHHEQDSTHISYNVITAGLVAGRMQLEASTFHGQEPNENRWAIGTGRPDSFATRLTIAPWNWVGQFSIGRINHREALEPGLNTLRTTASIHHHIVLKSGSLATSLIWGRNKDVVNTERRIFNSYGVESTLNFKTRNWAWGRIENVDRDRTLLFGETPAALAIEETPIGRVQAYNLGYERDILRKSPWWNVGVGFQYSVYGLTPEMKTVYGNRPQSFVMFVRLRPVGNVSEHMRLMHR